MGVIVVNNAPGDPSAMGQDGTPDQPTINGVMVALSDRAAIRGLAGTPATVDGAAAREFITQNQNVIANFSSVGPVDRTSAVKPDITGPGVNIYSSVPGGTFALFSGTSMATPHTAGLAALLLQQHPSWTPDQVKSALVTTAQRVISKLPQGPANAGVLQRGGGLIDLAKAGGATAAFSPAIVGFGVREANGVLSAGQTVTVTNLTGSAQTLTATVSQATTTPVAFSVSPATLTVPANGSATLTVTVTASGAPAGKDFEGDVAVSGGGSAARLPLWIRFK